jgi:hypothetical protein
MKIGKWINNVARDFEAYRQGTVVVQVVDVPWEQILDDLYAGFVTSPMMGGSVAILE